MCGLLDSDCDTKSESCDVKVCVYPPLPCPHLRQPAVDTLLKAEVLINHFHVGVDRYLMDYSGILQSTFFDIPF